MNLFVKERPILDNLGHAKENSIVSLEKVKIGGVNQAILIRGENASNPVLFMVHGGPGQSEMYLSHILNGPLEKHFTIVNWDQRGAGKSHTKAVKPTSMNLAQFVSDAEEVIHYVKKKLNKTHEKFYLQGHSFGTILSMLMIQQYPHHFHAYIGLAQNIGLTETLRVSYDFVMKKAKETGNQKAISELESIGKPPFHHFSKGLWKYSVWLEKFGGKMHSRPGREVFKAIFSAPEYGLVDKINFVKGSLFSVKHLHQELLQVDLGKLVTKVDIPIYFFIGKHDYACPFELSEQYFDILQAPSKELLYFEHSAHMPHYEETERYYDLLLYVLKQTQPKNKVD
ncbi:alpha/beta hydrolase [Cytobacillus suaedae]|nr:alpha/beta hydrolase [Cytobacillus suaedae]